MRLIPLHIFVGFLLLFMASCEKDSELSPMMEEGDCRDFQDFEYTNGFFVEARYQFKKPFFNPVNSDEFVYHYIDYENQNFQLKKFDLDSKEDITLIDAADLINQPKWSNEGWIVFNRKSDYNLYAVKGGGDSLQQVTFGAHNLYPVWNISSQHLIYEHTPNLGVPYYICRKHLIGDEIDTLGVSYSGHMDISIEGEIAAKMFHDGDSYIATFDVSMNDISEPNFLLNLSANQLQGVEGLCWNNTGSVLYFSVYEKGLFKYDVGLNMLEKLISFCDTKTYRSISCSPDGGTLVGERVDSHLELNQDQSPTGAIIQESNIYLIDLSTLSETKVDI